MRYELYELSFPNDKKYIGLSRNAVRRFAAHKATARSGSSMVVARAIRKFGESNVSMRVLCIGARDYIHELEINAISAYQTRNIKHGYNVGIGGENSPVEGIGHSLKSREKMSRSQKLRVHTPEEIAKMAASLKGRVFTPEHLEKLKAPKSASHRAAIGKALKGRSFSAKALALATEARRRPEIKAKIKTALAAYHLSRKLEIT